jgi:dihydrofolate reductase
MEAIYAVDLKNGLSKDGVIPWHSKKDLNFFMNMTLNNVVIMGKNTYFSLPDNYRPLKKRLNIVLTSKPENFLNYKKTNGVNELIFTGNHDFFTTILLNKNTFRGIYPFLKEDFKIFIIGGKTIYEQFIPLCEIVWVTIIKKVYSCDLFFDYDYSKEFKEEIVDEDEELIIKKYEKSVLPSG